jgi:transcriptional regulator
MYPPPYYTDNSPAFMAGVMRQNSFAVLTMVDSGGAITATHLPFVLKDEGPHGTLYGHIAKSNPQAELLGGTHDAMIVFSGPHAYISASWYERPDKQVPTWNYISVQAKGRPIALPREDYMAEMETLVAQYETDGAWTINNAQDYAEAIMNGIVYFKMEIDVIQGARKMSANKNKTEHANVIKQLIKIGETETAAAMAEIHI